MGGSNPVYQSRAPEARGERAISSDIELVREVNLDGSLLGVFYAHEVYQSGDVHTMLFTRRAVAAFRRATPAMPPPAICLPPSARPGPARYLPPR